MGSVLPITKTINIDLALLKKHYNDEIPKNLEEASSLFSEIIANHYNRFKFKETSIGQKLSANLSKFGHNSQSHTCSDESTVQSPYKKKSKISVTCQSDVDKICTGVNEMAFPPKVFSDGIKHPCTSNKCEYVPHSICKKELFHKKKTAFPSEKDEIKIQNVGHIQGSHVYQMPTSSHYMYNSFLSTHGTIQFSNLNVCQATNCCTE